MKNLTPNRGQNTSVDAGSAAAFAQQCTHAIRASIRRVSFWSAILLPLVYLPLLSGGLGPQTGYIAVGLLALNLIALLVGHNHATN